jgi:hypothetical protein
MGREDGVNVTLADKRTAHENRRDVRFRCRHLNAQGRLLIDALVAVGCSDHRMLERLGLGNGEVSVVVTDTVGNQREYTVFDPL